MRSYIEREGHDSGHVISCPPSLFFSDRQRIRKKVEEVDALGASDAVVARKNEEEEQ